MTPNLADSLDSLDGMLVAQVTPFTPGGADLDLDWLAGHIQWLRNFNISGILTLGTNGEGPSVALHERRRLIETVAREARGLTVIAGATTPSLPDTIRAANDALDAGAHAVALLPPYFFKNIESHGLVNWFSSVIESLPEGAHALLYNIPPQAGLDIPDEVLLALLDLHPDTLVGIKDSSGDAQRTRRYLDLIPASGPGSQFRVMAGADQAHADLYAAGCLGGVSGLANAVPALVNTIQYAHRNNGDPNRPQRQLNELHAILNNFPKLGALKQLINFTAGLPLTHARPPHRDLSKPEIAALEEAVGRYLLGAPPNPLQEEPPQVPQFSPPLGGEMP